MEAHEDPKAAVVVSHWPKDRRKGYRQMVTGVEIKYFHFQNSQHSTRLLMATYHIAVGETGAWRQAVASLRRGARALPSVGHGHRRALLVDTLLAETHIWEGNDTQRLHLWPQAPGRNGAR